MSGKREFGDYQTPQEFADRICHFLLKNKNINPKVVVEPTCGRGNFLSSSLQFGAERYFGIELQKEYYDYCKERFKQENIKIINEDIFNFSLKDKTGTEDILLIGNPPWVTNSTLSSLNSTNIPSKSNIKFLKGFDALTGASNFDICEYVILQLLNEYQDTNATLGMLCKTNVARNIFKELHRRKINFEYFEIIEFDSKKIFDINASACLLLMKLSVKESLPLSSDIYEFQGEAIIKKGEFGFKEGKFYSNLEQTFDFDGNSQFEWRQGVKHDNSKVMELTDNDGHLYNGLKERVNIENNLVFPLIKSSMVKKAIIMNSEKSVIVTQRFVKENTEHIKFDYPKTWEYLNSHLSSFEKRKSSIYKNAPQFSMFGIGDYSYSSYKVGVSGFYKKPLFSLLYAHDAKPIMMDDTGYFISFDDYNLAYVAMLCLNSVAVQSFLESIAFLDAKRPYTKKVLQRIDFKKVVSFLTIDELMNTEKELQINPYVTELIYNQFKDYVLGEQLTLF
ncbi:methyltransferase [Streptococcus azizii]|uniref:Methyltransferase n=1 Tax=Streptococcus azizii TaxID=1579424 RepID=A0AB36JNY4_9STRE|nr:MULTISPECIES: methyltransferase [Streptococcus]MBF0776097.1 methyltransferase [Streptococcus sp. 19428wD3_AN2]ONK28918.1 methyltransferase [Streptococcus azizii]ONK30429.1 methyltransferase [Streptococcus azizii]ONK31092.1 methyltransferase [Streptococcus azizii]TFU83658.1 methyltransferase [Streptococcus sp. AN2]